MAGSAEILQEYLVKLGFATDKVGLKKFGDGLGDISKSVLGVGGALAGMAVAAEVAVGKFASEMENLHYTSKLAGSSANSMQALELAGKSVGIMGDSLANGIKTLNFRLKDGTGLIQGFAASLGVSTAGKESAEVYTDIALALRKMKDAQGITGPSEGFASQMLGMSKEDYQLLINTPGALEKLIASEKKQLDLMKQQGIDFDKNGDSAVSYMTSLRELGSALYRVGSIILTWLEPASKGLNKFLTGSMEGLAVLLTSPSQAYTNFKNNMIDMNNNYVSPLAKNSNYGSPIVKNKTPSNPSDQLVLTNGNGTAQGDYNTGTKGVAGGHVGYSGKTDLQKMGAFKESETSNDILFKKMGAFKESETSDDILFKKMGAFKESETSNDILFKKMGAFNNKKVTRGVRNKNPGNLNFAGQRGASKEGGANGRFAVFNTMEDGVNALDKQLHLYVNRDKLDTIAKIVNKYAPGSENNVPAYIKALEKETGLDANSKIDLANPKIATSLRNGIIAHENAGYRLANLDETKLGVNKANSNASLVQNNTFNISGTDGHAMSKAVIAAQSRTNQDALRTLSSRVS